MQTHEQKIQFIIEQLNDRLQTGQPVAFEKNSVPHLVPNPNDPRYKRPKINLKSLNQILEIDQKNMICTAESGVAFVDLVKETMKHGLIPMTIPELKTITIGGAVSGCSVESMSYKYEGFHHSCVELEVITSDGKVITCSRENNKDVFDMIHGSYGTLGILTKLKFKLIPGKPFVKMTYKVLPTFKEFWTTLSDHCKKNDHDFVDGIVYDKKRFVVCLGQMVETVPCLSSYEKELIYYKSIVQKREDYLSLPEYFFRYDTECHWLSKQIPFAETKWFRRLFGKYFLGSTNMIRWSQKVRHLLRLKKRQEIVVDVFIPAYNFEKFYTWYEQTFNYYPLWIVPYAMNEIYPWVSDEHKQRIGKESLFIDCAIYGKKNSGKIDYSKLLEDKVFELNGVKTLIGKNDYTEQMFWEIYSAPRYQAVKTKTDPHHLFGDLYKKFHASSL